MAKRIGLAVLLCGVVAFLIASTTNGNPADKPKSEPEFAPKVLMVYTKDRATDTVLGDARVRRVGAKDFIVGKPLSRDGVDTAWDKAMRWVSVDIVDSMFEFDTVEDARKAEKAELERQGEKPTVIE